MKEIIIGNLTSILASIADNISTTRKTHREVLLVQCISQFFYAFGAFTLKGYSALMQNLVAVFRNLFGMTDVKSKIAEYFFVALAAILGIIFNNRGLLGWLPIVGNLYYSVAIFRYKNEVRKLKLALAINMLCFSIYNVFIYNYTAAILNLITAILSAVYYFKAEENE